jgi:hypothetical protein
LTDSRLANAPATSETLGTAHLNGICSSRESLEEKPRRATGGVFVGFAGSAPIALRAAMTPLRIDHVLPNREALARS